MELMLSLVSNVPSRVYGLIATKILRSFAFQRYQRNCNCDKTLKSGRGAHSRNFGRASLLGGSNAMMKPWGAL